MAEMDSNALVAWPKELEVQDVSKDNPAYTVALEIYDELSEKYNDDQVRAILEIARFLSSQI